MKRCQHQRPLRTEARFGALLFFWLAGATVACADPEKAAPNDWHSDFAQAEAEAKRLNKPLLIHFYATWCMPCKSMDRETLHSPELLSQFGDKVIGVKVDTDEHADLIERFDVRLLPTDVFVDPEGRIIGRSDGYQDRQAYLGTLARIDSVWTERMRLHIAKHSTSAETNGLKPLTDHGTQKPPGPQVPQPGKPKAGVGLDGFSPVALWHGRKWLRGDPQFAAEHKGIVFYMATDDELAQFRAQPERFAPQLLGCDPVIMSETDRAVAGITQYGAYFQGELFLFSSSETRARFRDNPARYARTRHVLRDEEVPQSIMR